MGKLFPVLYIWPDGIHFLVLLKDFCRSVAYKASISACIIRLWVAIRCELRISSQRGLYSLKVIRGDQIQKLLVGNVTFHKNKKLANAFDKVW